MTTEKEYILAHTQSLCPYCMKRVSATRVKKEEGVFLVKKCPEHGLMSTIIWKGKPEIGTWVRGKTPAGPKIHSSCVEKGCPFDCGLCPEHRQRTCTALLEITWRCNLHCPVCFADSGNEIADPGVDQIRDWYDEIRRVTGGGCNIQLSGGEPTVRDDLPQIIAMGKEMGFGFIQINTNGLRLAADSDFTGRLKQAGLDCVFLQFDGMDDKVHIELRGKKLRTIKERAIANCRHHNLGVVLVPTLVPGVNRHQIGDIIRFGLKNSPDVRGVHFQPVSYFGRYPKPPEDKDRMTLPQVIQAIEEQTGIKAVHFRPPG